MDWIKSYKKLEKSGKMLFIAQKLSINRYQAIGHLHSLWWWASENAEDGDISRFPKHIIASVSGWNEHLREKAEEITLWKRLLDDDTLPPIPLDAEKFFDVLVECGFVDETKQGRFIHNWNEHYGEFFEEKAKIKKRREMDRERLKRWRDKNAHETPMKRVSETVVKRDDETPETRKEKKKEVKEKEVKESQLLTTMAQSKFSVPSPEQVTTYAKSIGFDLDGQSFIDHYQSRGWKIGRTPIKDWQACVRTWKRRHQEDNPNAPDGSKSIYTNEPGWIDEWQRKNREAAQLRKKESAAKQIPSGL